MLMSSLPIVILSIVTLNMNVGSHIHFHTKKLFDKLLNKLSVPIFLKTFRPEF